jgi:hypothetical protein
MSENGLLFGPLAQSSRWLKALEEVLCEVLRILSGIPRRRT